MSLQNPSKKTAPAPKEIKLDVDNRTVTLHFSDTPKPSIAKQLKDALIESHVRNEARSEKKSRFSERDAR